MNRDTDTQLRPYLTAAISALASLDRADTQPERLARFMMAMDCCLQAARSWLVLREHSPAPAPADVIRQCHNKGVLDDDETIEAFAANQDRERVLHGGFGGDMAGRLPDYRRLMGEWVARLDERAH